MAGPVVRGDVMSKRSASPYLAAERGTSYLCAYNDGDGPFITAGENKHGASSSLAMAADPAGSTVAVAALVVVARRRVLFE